MTFILLSLAAVLALTSWMIRSRTLDAVSVACMMLGAIPGGWQDILSRDWLWLSLAVVLLASAAYRAAYLRVTSGVPRIRIRQQVPGKPQDPAP